MVIFWDGLEGQPKEKVIDGELVWKLGPPGSPGTQQLPKTHPVDPGILVKP